MGGAPSSHVPVFSVFSVVSVVKSVSIAHCYRTAAGRSRCREEPISPGACILTRMTDNSNLNRRQLLRGLSAGALGAGFLLEEISARAADQPGAAAGAAPARGAEQ